MIKSVGALDRPSGADDGSVASTSTPASLIPLPAAVPDLQQAYITVVARVLPSVVQITADGSLGSGIVFDTEGNIVTNAHVVGQATKFQVRLVDSPKPLPASLVGSYPPDDLAVIKLDQPPPSLRPAQFGDSARLKVGQIVLPWAIRSGWTEASPTALSRPPAVPSPNLPEAPCRARRWPT
jgi:S1-C subfamily serine protease